MEKYCEKGIAQVKNSILYHVYLKQKASRDWWHVNHACYAALGRSAWGFLYRERRRGDSFFPI